MEVIDLTGDSDPAPAGPSSIPLNTLDIHDVLSQINLDSFDWEAYEGTYKGRALITRLNHIPSLILSHSKPPTPQTLQLARTALKRLLPLVQRTWDTSLYLHIMTALETKRGAVPGDEDVKMDSGPQEVGAMGPIDTDWVQQAKEDERREGTRLDVELRGYMSNLIKESIRLTYLAFAQLSLKAGKPADALKHYSQAREYSTSPSHHVDLGVGIIEASLAFNHPAALAGHISKLEAALDRAYPAPITTRGGAGEAANLTATDVRENREREARSAGVRSAVSAKIRVAKGLEALSRRDWERAGRELGEGIEEGGLGEWEGEAISTADMALITAMCTLATAKRDRIRRVLLDRTSFRSAVDDSQGWIIDLIRAFMEAKYGEVTTILNKAEPYLLLNPFLCIHTRDLIILIQTRAIVQYVAPFTTIKIEIMAKAFDRDTSSMLREVEGLVRDGQIKGRVDLIDGVLEMNQPNERKELFKEAVATAKKTTTTTRAALLRMKLHEAGIVVDPRPPSDAIGQKLGLGPTDSLELEGLGGGGGMDDIQLIR